MDVACVVCRVSEAGGDWDGVITMDTKFAMKELICMDTGLW